ncbi:MAG: acyl-CoA dehydrogenase family protein [Ardenticatenales bacterium]|nr:acyl-CoA dehydrogenase family protein [Ardenticatenales bacterium]
MGFALSDEHRALRSLAHRFALEVIRPGAPRFDEEETVPWEVLRQAAEVGLTAYALPEAYGGGGVADVFGRCVVDEELYWGCAGVATVLGGTLLAATPILLSGTPEQKERYIPRFCDPRAVRLGAFALTEPAAGSDASALTTTARRDGAEYVLNGSKCFITNGGIADTYVLFATVAPGRGADGIAAFIVDGDRAGLTAGRGERKLGIRASHTASLYLEDVRVPAANRLGGEADGFRIAMRTLDRTRAQIAAGAVGIARAAFEFACQYAGERRQFGRPIGQFQAIGTLLADMATSIEAARLLAWRAAWLADQGLSHTTESSMAKAFAADVAMRVTTDAVQVLGGYGYSREYPVEKWMRDAKIMQIYEGTAQIQRLVIARGLLAGAGAHAPAAAKHAAIAGPEAP